MIIESKDNKIVKYAKKLESKKFAISEGKTLIESPKIILELLEAGFNIDYIFMAKGKDLCNFAEYKSKIVYISDTVVKYLSQTETSTGVFAIVSTPNSINKLSDKIVILDNIQDPTNYGTICRSALAFGFTTILDINCCYPYSSKVTRCAMGNNFKLNIIKCSCQDIEKIKKENNLEIFCCDMNGKDVKNSRPNGAKFAIIIGNEGNGVSKELTELADSTISIPMSDKVESLNASVSAGIIMYTFANL